MLLGFIIMMVLDLFSFLYLFLDELLILEAINFHVELFTIVEGGAHAH